MSDRSAKSTSASKSPKPRVTQLNIYRVLMKLGAWSAYDAGDNKSIACFLEECKDMGLPRAAAIQAIDALRESGDIEFVDFNGEKDICLTKLGAQRAKALKRIQDEGPQPSSALQKSHKASCQGGGSLI